MDEKLIGIERAALVQAEIYMDGKRSFAMVELLPEPAPALPKLARFLQGHVDRFYGREGEDNLPEDIYIVFLCNFDPLGMPRNTVLPGTPLSQCLRGQKSRPLRCIASSC